MVFAGKELLNKRADLFMDHCAFPSACPIALALDGVMAMVDMATPHPIPVGFPPYRYDILQPMIATAVVLHSFVGSLSL